METPGVRTRWAVALAAHLALAGTAAGKKLPFTDSFRVEECTFSNTGRNTYFVLEPGYRLALEGKNKGVLERVTITVLDEAEVVDGVETRVVEERETKDGVLAEVSRNFFAFCAPTNTAFYFGEHVDNYEGGVIVDNDGSWRAGVGGARPGVIMPGLNLVGARYMQEVAPGVALDRAETISVTDSLTTPAGAFSSVLKVKETTPLERRARDFKFYAPGIGLIQDGPLQLVAPP
jgi:hypothetical protein